MSWEVMIPVILVFLVIMIILFAHSRRNYATRDQYDERQLMIRMNAYKYAAVTMLVCAVLYFCVTQFAKRQFTEDGVSALLIALVGVAVFAIYSIFNDAFFGITGNRGGFGKPELYCLLVTVIVIGNGISAVRMFKQHMMIQDGVLTHNVMSFALAILFLFILIAIGIKYILNKREDEEA